MKELNVNELIDTTDDNKINEFVEQIDSEMRVQTDYSKDSFDDKWVGMFEITMPYLEKIMLNPKKFITTEEEIVKIESAKKIGVETVKHLSKHTNFIQDIDEKTGDVVPSKLLNVLKEETYNTYENRFIYTLLHYMLQFIKSKEEGQVKDPRLKDNKSINYVSTTKVGEENIRVNISLDTNLDTSLNTDPRYQVRIDKIKKDIKNLQNSEMYKSLEKEDVSFVINPIKKTNVILKNVNFQYAMRLWDYIYSNMTEKKQKKEQQKKDYMEKGKIKGFIDETFLLEYLTINSINNKENDKDIEEAKGKSIERLIDKVINMYPELTKKQLQEKLGEKFEKVKKVRITSKKDIEKIFRKHIDKYFSKIG